ncbi:chea signal transduction histidine kinase, putative [Heliomicrobium modesticaldum Ice1]|uniref:Stage 0 sporulation protein A homolog n=1 Tax=Heliobacterium modesticaldum (strain ATCC 51547 / Ice1) TaxID=498761 RepID=B0TG87_HELMI|nr:hybrid sensor histidine kinase/response regulator [Heliomicrobium modesticaldum]ABZ84583.1 chea signal transduction histidine kinase, putative [Heliomicrobium modesticaldum Ice1]
MRIGDDELRELFQIESTERLDRMEANLLRLEEAGAEPSLLTELYRDAHSLKGAARLVEQTDMERLAHQLEDRFDQVKSGAMPVTPVLVTELEGWLDNLRKMAYRAVTGDAAIDFSPDDRPEGGAESRTVAPSDAAAAAPSAATRDDASDNRSAAASTEGEAADRAGQSQSPADKRPSMAEANPSTDPMTDGHRQAGQKALRRASGEPSALREPESSADARFETVRIATSRLDALLQETGELTVVQRRIEDRAQQFAHLISSLEEAVMGTSFHHDGIASSLLRGRFTQLIRDFSDLHKLLSTDTERLSHIAHHLHEEVRHMRLMPLSILFGQFPRLVRDLARDQGKEIRLEISGDDILVDKLILEQLKDPLVHLIRNAIDHGVERASRRRELGKPALATIRLAASRTETHVHIEVSDDGAGLDAAAIRRKAMTLSLRSRDELEAMTAQQIQALVFESGFSTRSVVSNISGRGIGLDVVKHTVEKLKGMVQIHSAPGEGSTFRLKLPLSLMTTAIVVVKAGRYYYGIPAEWVTNLIRISTSDIYKSGGAPAIRYEGQPISVAELWALLELDAPALRPAGEHRFCVVISTGEAADSLALIVDAFITEGQVIVKPFCPLLKRVRNVLGATTLGTGEVCMVLNPHDLIRTVRKGGGRKIPDPVPQVARKPRVLLADDSITTRVQLKRVVESGGYEVVACVNGAEAWKRLQLQDVQAVLSDVEMPEMDGFALTEKIRQSPSLKDLPVILITSLSCDAERQRGVDVGADAYIVKSSFDQAFLLETLRRLIQPRSGASNGGGHEKDPRGPCR